MISAWSFILLLLQGGQVVGQGGYLGLGASASSFWPLASRPADLLGKGLALVAQAVRLLAGFPVFLVQGYHLVHQGQLLILELFADVFLDPLGVVAQQIDVQHGYVSSSMVFSLFRREKRKSPPSLPGTMDPRCHPACRVPENATTHAP